MARETGWVKRRSRCFSARDLVSSLVAEAAGGDGSFVSLCASSGARCSPQNIHKRLNESACQFLASVLAGALSSGAQASLQTCEGSFAGRILLEDCSHFQAPDSLTGELPAHGNQHGQTAGAKLHLVVEASSATALRADLRSAICSDQSLADLVVEEDLREGDLLIRDKGFFCSESLARIELKGARYLSRVPRSLVPRDREGVPLDLVSLLKDCSGDVCEIIACLGREVGLPTRLVMMRVPDRIARQRKRECRRCRNQSRGRLPAAELVHCHWELLVTNLRQDEIAPQEIATLYRCRWRIELIFKALKSGDFARRMAAKRTSVHHWLALVLARLIGLALILPLEAEARASLPSRRPPSLLKLVRTGFDWLRTSLLESVRQRPEVWSRTLRRCLSMDSRARLNHHDFLHQALGR